MKFAIHLATHITPEWRKQYINYEELKQQLYDAIEQAPPADKVDASTLARHFVDADETFFSNCEKELSKVNIFYSEKIAEAMRKFASLQHDLAAAFSMDIIGKPSYYTKNTNKIPPKKPSTKKLRKLEMVFSEFYLSLVLLQNYQTLNYSGFRKILKKHDKLFALKNGEYWRRENVDLAPFYVNKDTDRLIEETENMVTIYLEDGNKQRAMKRLHIPPIGEHQSIWTTFNLGLLMGIFFSLLAICILVVIRRMEAKDTRIMLRLYRGTFFFILFIFLCGLNVYGWRTSGVNHILIFEINPRSHLTEQHILQIASIFGILWTSSVLAFVFSPYVGVPAYTNPVILVSTLILFLFNPTKTLFHEARWWFLKIVGRILLAPFFKVNFSDFWLAEQFTSFVPLFLDIYFLVCFYGSNEFWLANKVIEQSCMVDLNPLQPILMCLPAWFRLAQCFRRFYDSRHIFPHVISALKYVSMSLVILFAYLNAKFKKSAGKDYVEPNLYFYLWMVSVISCTTFVFLWDVKIDWGLFSGNALDNKCLREQIIYSSEGYYYAAIGLNFVLRFCWAFTLSLPDITYNSGDFVILVITPLEIFRRFLWNFMRLENEHLNNCGEFRAIRDISIVPLETVDRDQDVLLRMMDEPDGVANRHRRFISTIDSKKSKVKVA